MQLQREALIDVAMGYEPADAVITERQRGQRPHRHHQARRDRHQGRAHRRRRRRGLRHRRRHRHHRCRGPLPGAGPHRPPLPPVAHLRQLDRVRRLPPAARVHDDRGRLLRPRHRERHARVALLPRRAAGHAGQADLRHPHHVLHAEPRHRLPRLAQRAQHRGPPRLADLARDQGHRGDQPGADALPEPARPGAAQPDGRGARHGQGHPGPLGRDDRREDHQCLGRLRNHAQPRDRQRFGDPPPGRARHLDRHPGRQRLQGHRGVSSGDCRRKATTPAPTSSAPT